MPQHLSNGQIPDDERLPLLYLDVNMGKGRSSRLVFYQGDQPEAVAASFIDENGNGFHFVMFDRPR